jgi:hypothetical protein
MVSLRTPNEQDTSSLAAEQAIIKYAEAHERLYRRPPRGVRVLNQEWVIVNGAQIRVSELQHLTRQLTLEFEQSMAQRKSIVLRLLRFFRSDQG